MREFFGAAISTKARRDERRTSWFLHKHKQEHWENMERVNLSEAARGVARSGLKYMRGGKGRVAGG